MNPSYPTLVLGAFGCAKGVKPSLEPEYLGATREVGEHDILTVRFKTVPFASCHFVLSSLEGSASADSNGLVTWTPVIDDWYFPSGKSETLEVSATHHDYSQSVTTYLNFTFPYVADMPPVDILEFPDRVVLGGSLTIKLKTIPHSRCTVQLKDKGTLAILEADSQGIVIYSIPVEKEFTTSQYPHAVFGLEPGSNTLELIVDNDYCRQNRTWQEISFLVLPSG